LIEQLLLGVPYVYESENLLLNNGIQITRDNETYEKLSDKYSVPQSEIRFIDLNRTGIFLPNNVVRIGFRVRFLTEINDHGHKKNTYFALPVRDLHDSNFSVRDKSLAFNNYKFGKLLEQVNLDTCDVSYSRGKKLLNLNSRRRGNCGGCSCCVHHYKNLYDSTVLKDAHELESEEDIGNFFNDYDKNKEPIKNLEQIAVVTGLFHSETEVIKHLHLIHNAARKLGFGGELLYFGCEVNSPGGLEQLAKINNMTFIYAIDVFSQREKILHKSKSEISVKDASETLKKAKKLGINTTYAYITGIDDTDSMRQNAEFLMDSITRFPIVNIYQVQTKQQVSVMHPTAKKLDYYLESRKLFENFFSDKDLRPRTWENYRPLWYEYFNGKPLA
jgi:hypothetical protein